MIEDKVKIKKANEKMQKEKAKELSDTLKEVVPLLWKIIPKYNEEKHWLKIERRNFVFIPPFSLDPTFVFSGFSIVPSYENNRLKDIYLCVANEKEEEYGDYGMAKKFAKRVEGKYPGQYSVKIVPLKK